MDLWTEQKSIFLTVTLIFYFQDMYKVYVAVGKLSGMKETLESFGEDATIIRENFITDIGESMKDFEKFMQLF